MVYKKVARALKKKLKESEIGLVCVKDFCHLRMHFDVE
jgi:hypothetical protein